MEGSSFHASKNVRLVFLNRLHLVPVYSETPCYFQILAKTAWLQPVTTHHSFQKIVAQQSPNSGLSKVILQGSCFPWNNLNTMVLYDLLKKAHFLFSAMPPQLTDPR